MRNNTWIHVHAHRIPHAYVGDLEHWRTWPSPLSLPEESSAVQGHESNAVHVQQKSETAAGEEDVFEEEFGGVAVLRSGSPSAELEMPAFSVEAALGYIPSRSKQTHRILCLLHAHT